jgi:hypothetical protein
MSECNCPPCTEEDQYSREELLWKITFQNTEIKRLRDQLGQINTAFADWCQADQHADTPAFMRELGKILSSPLKEQNHD